MTSLGHKTYHVIHVPYFRIRFCTFCQKNTENGQSSNFSFRRFFLPRKRGDRFSSRLRSVVYHFAGIGMNGLGSIAHTGPDRGLLFCLVGCLRLFLVFEFMRRTITQVFLSLRRGRVEQSDSVTLSESNRKRESVTSSVTQLAISTAIKDLKFHLTSLEYRSAPLTFPAKR